MIDTYPSVRAAASPLQRGALGVVLLVVATGCGDPGGPPPPPEPWSAVADLRADVDRDGSVGIDDLSDELGEETWTPGRGALFLANLDDDSRRCPPPVNLATPSDLELAACHDAADEVINGEVDLADLARLRILPLADAPDDAFATLGVDGAAGQLVRLFIQRPGGFTVLRPGARITAAELRAGVELAAEALDVVRDPALWSGTADLRLRVERSDGPGDPSEDVVRLRVAPVILFNHLDPAEEVFVSDLAADVPGAATFQAGIDAARDRAGITRPLRRLATTDRWAQDLFEEGYMTMPAPGATQQVMRVYLRSAEVYSPTDPANPLRSGGRVVFELRGPDVAALQQFQLGTPFSTRTFNAMGNTETIPPFSHQGADYPLGRILRGGTETLPPDPSFSRLLEAQGVQAPLYVDTSWLSVGHVDEIFSFLPAPTARGWVVLVADPALAVQFLRDLEAGGHGDALLFAGRSWIRSRVESPAEVSVSQLLADTTVTDANAEASGHLEAQLAVLKAATGLTDAEVIRVPVLHRAINGKLAAYQPGAVNLLSLGPTLVVAAQPFGPRIDGKDPFETAVEAALSPLGIAVHWVDDWDLLHRYVGNIHCGTNVSRRIPAQPWWAQQ